MEAVQQAGKPGGHGCVPSCLPAKLALNASCPPHPPTSLHPPFLSRETSTVPLAKFLSSFPMKKSNPPNAALTAET